MINVCRLDSLLLACVCKGMEVQLSVELEKCREAECWWGSPVGRARGRECLKDNAGGGGGGSIEGLPVVLPSLRPQSARSGTPDLNKPIKVACCKYITKQKGVGLLSVATSGRENDPGTSQVLQGS